MEEPKHKFNDAELKILLKAIAEEANMNSCLDSSFNVSRVSQHVYTKLGNICTNEEDVDVLKNMVEYHSESRIVGRIMRDIYKQKKELTDASQNFDKSKKIAFKKKKRKREENIDHPVKDELFAPPNYKRVDSDSNAPNNNYDLLSISPTPFLSNGNEAQKSTNLYSNAPNNNCDLLSISPTPFLSNGNEARKFEQPLTNSVSFQKNPIPVPTPIRNKNLSSSHASRSIGSVDEKYRWSSERKSGAKLLSIELFEGDVEEMRKMYYLRTRNTIDFKIREQFKKIQNEINYLKYLMNEV